MSRMGRPSLKAWSLRSAWSCSGRSNVARTTLVEGRPLLLEGFRGGESVLAVLAPRMNFSAALPETFLGFVGSFIMDS